LRKHIGNNRIHRHRHLLARREIIHPDRAGLDITVPGDQRQPRARTVSRATAGVKPG
jgi:hypothetical protein